MGILWPLVPERLLITLVSCLFFLHLHHLAHMANSSSKKDGRQQVSRKCLYLFTELQDDWKVIHNVNWLFVLNEFYAVSLWGS